MKQIDLNKTIQTIANVGVVLGIVFLVVEIRQNTNVVRSATIQALSEQSYESIRLALENPDVREAYFAALEGTMTDQQQQIMTMLFHANLRIRQNRYLQDRFGILDVEVSGELGTGAIYRMSAFRDYWAAEGDRYSPGFQHYVEQILLPLSAPIN